MHSLFTSPWCAAALAVGLCLPAWAGTSDIICTSRDSCNNNWQDFVTPLNHIQGPDPHGFAYFDGFSWDAPNANIAYFIEGQGYWLNDPSSPDSRLPWWGNTDGSAVNSFYFQRSSDVMEANLLYALGSWSPYNSVGWYDPFSSAWGWVFLADGLTPTPHMVDFTPTADFGLFFVPDIIPDPTNLNAQPAYFTNANLNGIAATDVAYADANNIPLGPETGQHFAVFNAGSGGYYIGVKDRSLQISDSDYNDMIFTLAPTPEPRGMIPLGLLLLIILPRLRSGRSDSDIDD